MKFTSKAMQELKQQVGDDGERATKWDINNKFKINRQITEGAIMFLKGDGILLMHDKAMEQ